MDFYFNELSLERVADNLAADVVLREFLLLNKALTTRGFEFLRLPEEGVNQLKRFEISPRYFVFDWLKDTSGKVDVEYQRRFKVLLLKSSFIDRDDPDIPNLEGFECKTASHRTVDAIGLHVSHTKSSIAVSFRTNSAWDNSIVKVHCFDLNFDYNAPSRHIDVIHASSIAHIYEHQAWICTLYDTSRISFNWEPDVNQFPRKDEASRLVLDADWNKYYAKIAQMSPKDRQTEANVMGRRVAQVHGYEYDSVVSAKNKSDGALRFIYSAGIAKHKVYLSVDVRHVRFEVCNYLGEAIYECDYNGKRTGNGHNIDI